MRKKTEKKRDEIIKAAIEIFEELGYEKASMSKICSRFGGSKTTLYNYFSSKEELFVEIITILNAEESDFVYEAIHCKSEIVDLHSELLEFGKRFLKFIYSSKFKKIRKLTINQSDITDLGKIIYKNRILKSQEILSSYIDKAIEIKKIKKTNSTIAARHLYALLESELIYQFLFQIEIDFTNEEMSEMAERAVDVFISAYCE